MVAMRAGVGHVDGLSEHVLILSIQTRPVPVLLADRVVIDDVGYTDDGLTHVEARFGYMDAPESPECS
jgi:KUP system potassium uptake protein